MKVNTNVYFDDITHSYLTKDGKYLMGVTSLMRKHGLAPDYTDIPQDILDRAAERGSKVHKDIELYCKGVIVKDTPELKVFRKLNLPVIANEYLVSDNEIVASSIDIVTDAGDDMVDLIDIKTTSTLHTEPLSWQLSIYAYLFELQNPTIKVGKLYGLHIRNGKGKLVQVKRIDSVQIEELLTAEREGLSFIPRPQAIAPKEDALLAQLKDVSLTIAALKEQIKMQEAVEKEIKEKLLQSMESSAQKVIENDYIKISYIEPSERITIDKDKLNEDYPQLYERYKKVSLIAPSIRIKIK